MGLDYQTKWIMEIYIRKKEIHIRKSKQTFKINPNSSHWTLPIQSNSRHKQAKNMLFNVNLLDMTEGQLRKHVKKVQQNFFLRNSSQTIRNGRKRYYWSLETSAEDSRKPLSVDLKETCVMN